MNQRDSTLVRIGRDLKFQLEQLALRWQELAGTSGSAVPYNPDGERVSLDKVIRELLRRDVEHRNRSNRKKGNNGPWTDYGKVLDIIDGADGEDQP